MTPESVNDLKVLVLKVMAKGEEAFVLDDETYELAVDIALEIEAAGYVARETRDVLDQGQAVDDLDQGHEPDRSDSETLAALIAKIDRLGIRPQFWDIIGRSPTRRFPSAGAQGPAPWVCIRLPRLAGSRAAARNLIAEAGEIGGWDVVIDTRELRTAAPSFVHELLTGLAEAGAQVIKVTHAHPDFAGLACRAPRPTV